MRNKKLQSELRKTGKCTVTTVYKKILGSKNRKWEIDLEMKERE